MIEVTLKYVQPMFNGRIRSILYDRPEKAENMNGLFNVDDINSNILIQEY